MRHLTKFELAVNRVAFVLATMVCAAGIAGVIGHTTGAPAAPGVAPSEARRPVESFLATYVDASGRVVRRDQGGDTVSEGQSYGLLLAVAAGDGDLFGSIWTWTKQHLQRPDGLLAWHWAGGRVLDWMPAADADVDTAWALGLAATRFGVPSYAADARRIAASVLADETVTTSIGTVLVAGPWARAFPALIEPGYFSPEAFAELERVTGDQRWAQISSTAMTILGRLDGASKLPPEWASVTASGAVAPHAPPGSSSPPSFGLGAARALLWTAPCGGAGAALVARAWPELEPSASHKLYPLQMSLGGHPETPDASAVTALADAAAAAASGERLQAASLLETASQLSARYPTYYGSAWVAIAYYLLSSEVPGGCLL